jgi:hypothetical protein
MVFHSVLILSLVLLVALAVIEQLVQNSDLFVQMLLQR